VNTFQNPNKTGDDEAKNLQLTRASNDEKRAQIERLRAFQAAHADDAEAALEQLKAVALAGGNIFAELMHTTRVASLGQITQALFQVGGEYRRSM
jgi:methylmalonyl-CoA mutase